MRGNRGMRTAGVPLSALYCIASSSGRFLPARRKTSRATARIRPFAVSGRWPSCGSGWNLTGAFSSATDSGGGGHWTVSAAFPAYAVGSLSSLVLSLGGRGAGMSRRIAASIATAAGSSIRSGNPCSIRERLASCAPASRMASRSWWLRAGCRAGVARSVLVPSFVPSSAFARLRADARVRGGTGRPAGRSLTVTAPPAGARASARG